MTATVSPHVPASSLGWRCVRATIGAAMGLCIGAILWTINWLSGQHLEVLVTTIVLTLIQAGIGFFVPMRKAAWMDAILYFLLLGFLDN